MKLPFLVLIILISSCKNENKVPKYVSNLQLDSYEYKELPLSEGSLYLDTLIFETYYDLETAKDSDPILNFIVDIEKINGHYWILDAQAGMIHKYDVNGEYVDTIAKNGKGPNDLLNPASINTIEEDDGQIKIFVIDSGLSSLIEYDENGKEINRIISEFINTNFYSLKLVTGNNNTFFIQQSVFNDSMLVQIDTEAKLVNKYIPRITPLSDSYISHNYITYEYGRSQNILIYGFKGLPLIFIVTESEKYLFNLIPNKELTEFNKPFIKKSKNSSIESFNNLQGQGVKAILQNLSILEKNIYFTFNREFYSIDLTTNKVTKYELVESTGQPIKGFSNLKLKNSEIFLINPIKKKIYKSFIN